MYKEYIICGPVNKTGKLNIPVDITINNLIEEYADGMKKGHQLKMVQIGGPLGIVIEGQGVKNTLNTYRRYGETNTIMIFDQNFCPVDYLRFLTRYSIRELTVDTPYLRNLNKYIEDISQGKDSERSYYSLQQEMRTTPSHIIEKHIYRLFTFILAIYKDEIEEHVFMKKCKTGICRGLIISQCINACPAEVNIPGYIELMKQGETKLAYDLMRQNNPLSLICGKICARPCESRCRRGEIESSVGVRALKYYAANITLNTENYCEKKNEPLKKTVGIIGGGPAGLSAAYYLAKTGYGVTIYEKEAVVGGMLATGIPSFRLTQDEIDKEVQLILNLGVQIRNNTNVGVDVSFQELEQSYDALLLATGRPSGITSGPQNSNVESAVDFLRDVKIEGRQNVGKDVVIVGGGDVAFDAARTAIRLGAETVKVVSLEEIEELPASEEEVIAAVEEGVELCVGYGVHDYCFKGDGINHIYTKKCTSILDENNSFNPQFDLSDTRLLKATHVIYAIGQQPDTSYLNGCITIENRSLTTTKPNIFAAGDLIQGGIAIKAIAEAHKAAGLIDAYLRGRGLYEGEEISIPEKTLKSTMWDIEKGSELTILDSEGAIKEASRCMRCDRNSIAPLFLR